MLSSYFSHLCSRISHLNVHACDMIAWQQCFLLQHPCPLSHSPCPPELFLTAPRGVVLWKRKCPKQWYYSVNPTPAVWPISDWSPGVNVAVGIMLNSPLRNGRVHDNWILWQMQKQTSGRRMHTFIRMFIYLAHYLADIEDSCRYNFNDKTVKILNKYVASSAVFEVP